MNELEAWVQKWFEKADRDLELARISAKKKNPFYDMACYHAQQCAEKCLKGFLTAHQREVEKTHDLLTLLETCVDVNDAFFSVEQACKTLNSYAVEVRYPDSAEPTIEEAAAALDAAARIRAFTRAQVPFDVP